MVGFFTGVTDTLNSDAVLVPWFEVQKGLVSLRNTPGVLQAGVDELSRQKAVRNEIGLDIGPGLGTPRAHTKSAKANRRDQQ
jgi:hypothetical protein